MGHRAARRLAALLGALALPSVGCSATTSAPIASAPLPTSMVVLGPAGSASGTDDDHCAAVLIAPKRVLTAASCVRKRKVRAVGARVLDPDGCRTTIRRRAREAVTLPSGDAAVVRLRGRVPPAASEPPVVTDVPAAGGVVLAWGWGSARPGDGCVPRPVRLQVVSDEECAVVVGEDRLGRYFCAVPEDATHTCRGDRGGPVMDDQGRLIGITVTGRRCGTDEPERYWKAADLVPRSS
jgi:hypothetical protein